MTMELIQSATMYQHDYSSPHIPERLGSFPPSTMSTHTVENRSYAGSVPPSYAPGPPSETTIISEPEVHKDQTPDINMQELDKPHDLSVARTKEEELIDDNDLYAKDDQTPVPGISSVSSAGVDEDTIMPSAESEPQTQTGDPIEEDLRAEAAEGGLEILGGGMRRMVDLVNRLRASGIEDLGLPLPRIAVVGNQSAGKSSLIEAISGIKVPRYTGTCTRCPLEINLSESSSPTDPWNCRISLRFKKRYEPSPSDGPQSRTSSNRTRSPWVDQATEQVAFLEITDKGQVEPVLVAAQRAVLNPSRNWRDYVYELRPEMNPQYTGAGGRPGWQGSGGWAGFGKKQMVAPKKNAEEDFEVKFSPNVVCMEITGPDLPNLAFIDLPGVIQTTESENEHYLIDLVTGLVKEYVQEEDCLIMLAMTMKDDAVNQSAARLAREFGEERTIGALTKPDTVGPGEYNQWINILRGTSHRLKHGYFVTKQPNQEQLVQGIDHAQARAQEADFFENTEPWKTELKDLKARFGTQALQSYLAKELGELIRKRQDRLPEIIGSIRKQHAEVKEKLEALPPPPTDNQTFIVHNLIRDFDSFLGGHLIGGPGHNEFQQELRRTAEKFQRALKSVRPVLKLFETHKEEVDFAEQLETPRKQGTARRTNRRAGEGGEWFGDREREVSPSLRGAGKRGVEVHTLSSDEENVTGVQSKKRRGANEMMTPTSKKSKRMANVAIGTGSEAHKFNLLQIRHIIDSTATARIPGQVDPTAIANLIKQTVILWNPIVHDFLNECGRLLNDRVLECFKHVFKGYSRSPIFGAVYNILNHLVNESFQEQKDTIQRLWLLEEDQISTLNDEDIHKYTESHLKILTERRARNLEEHSRVAAAEAEAKENEEKNMTPRKRRTLQPLPIRENQPDPYRKEIEVLAQVRAYNEVAQKRFVDNVYMSIQGEFVNGFRKRILDALQTGLGLKVPEVAEICTDLLVEDPEKEKRRKELLGKSEQLARAMEELSRL